MMVKRFFSSDYPAYQIKPFYLFILDIGKSRISEHEEILKLQVLRSSHACSITNVSFNGKRYCIDGRARKKRRIFRVREKLYGLTVSFKGL